MLVEGNGLLRRVGEEIMESRWVKDLLNDLRKAGVMSESIRNEIKESIREKMRELDAREWMSEMNEKSKNIQKMEEGDWKKPTITTKLQKFDLKAGPAT